MCGCSGDVECKCAKTVLLELLKMSKSGPSEPIPKLHSVLHPDVSDQPLLMQAFSAECKKILTEGESGQSRKPYDLKGATLYEMATDMGETEENVAALKDIMDPMVFVQDDGMPNPGHSFSLVREKQLYQREAVAVATGNSLIRPVSLGASVGVEREQLSEDELVISVALFSKKKKRKELEYNVLGSQPLTALKDAVLCPSDFLPTQDCSGLLWEEAKKTIRKRTDQPSGSFFINGTFYNDTRHPRAIDYSRSILDREWLASRDLTACPRLDDYTTASMHDTRFIDLSLRLGYPYLYCHCGDCEHIVIFQQVRLIHPDDPQYLADYPRLLFSCRRQMRECSICRRAKAVWITTEDRLALEDPSLFCDACYTMLHLDQGGKKLYDYKAFPFIEVVTPDMLQRSHSEQSSVELDPAHVT